MIGVDTNVLVRFLVQDDPVQSRQATALFEGTLSESNQGFVSTMAMAETVWVLERAYGFSDAAIAGVIESMLSVDALAIENEEQVFTAMIALKEGRGSFADALIAALGARAGCTTTLTFDRQASRLSEFSLLS